MDDVVAIGKGLCEAEMTQRTHMQPRYKRTVLDAQGPSVEQPTWDEEDNVDASMCTASGRLKKKFRGGPKEMEQIAQNYSI